MSLQNSGESQRRETADSALFAGLYPELAPKFLDYEKARKVFREIVSTRDACLELGMGNGQFALPLLNEGYHIDGLEPGGEMLEKLKANLQGVSVQPTLFERSAQNFEFGDRYEKIFSHSGPFFFVNDPNGLYLEGLRHDQTKGEDPIRSNEETLRKILEGVEGKSGSVLIKAQDKLSRL